MTIAVELKKARTARQAAERAVTAAVDRGDIQSAEKHAATYVAAGAEEDRLEAALIQNYGSERG